MTLSCVRQVLNRKCKGQQECLELAVIFLYKGQAQVCFDRLMVRQLLMLFAVLERFRAMDHHDYSF